MSQRSAAQWLREGLDALETSRYADYGREYFEDLQRALAAFDEAVALEPRHTEAMRERARVLMRLEKFPEAVDAYVAVSQLQPPDALLLLETARALAAAKRPEAALATAHEVSRLAPDDLDARVLAGEAAVALGRHDVALVAWNAAVDDQRFKGDFRQVRVLLTRALTLEHLGRAADASAAFRAVFAEHAGALDRLPNLETFTGALKSSALAREALTAHLERTVTTAPGWERAGSSWLAARLPQQARAAYERALALAPQSARAWFGIAEAWAQEGALEQAVAAYDRSLALEPGFLGAEARKKVAQEQLARG